MRRSLLAVAWLLAASPSWAQAPPASPARRASPDRPVRIGLLAHQGLVEAQKAWTPMTLYLERELPGTKFTLVPLKFGEVEEAVVAGRVDFILTNPAQYIGFEMRHLAMRVLTLKTYHRGVACKRLGAVVIVRDDRHDLRHLTDLKGKTFAAVDPASFGGWLIAKHALIGRGIDPDKDLRVTFEGTHDRVARAVLGGEADAGTVRSDELDRVDASKLRVLDPIPASAAYPLPSTTPLYPEWPLASLTHTSDELAQKVVIALLKLGPDDPVARSADSAGWTIPLNYRMVHEALRALHAGPYQHEGEVKLGDAIRQYRWWIIGAGSLIMALIAATGLALHYNVSHGRLRGHLETELAERVKAERALRDSEGLYHSLVETLPQNIFRKDTRERFTFVNRRFCATVGKPPEAILGRTDADLFPPEQAAKYTQDDQDVIRNRAHYETVEKHVTPDGQAHYVQVIKTPLLDSSGSVSGIQGIFWDVTGKRRAEEELARSEERFALAVRGSNDGLWDWNVEAGEIYYSPRFKELIGYPDHALPNTVDMHLSRIHPEDADRVRSKVRKHLKERVPFDVEYRLLTRSGEYLWFHARGQALWNKEGRATRMAGSLSDITSRKAFEAQLMEQNLKLQEMARSERKAHQDLKQAQSRMVSTAKLAGLGEMVAGVAHEINNPLSFVSNNVCVLQRDLAEVGELIGLYRDREGALPDGTREPIRSLWERMDMDYTLANLPGLLNRTRDGLKRIQQIVKDLRVFARLDESDLNEVDLNAGIDSTVNIVLGNAKRKQVRIDLDLRPLPPVTCYPAKINQVVMNLVSNAIDASHEGGVVEIKSDAEDSGVWIEVRDHGTGIDPAVRERIFDPFFTTKPIGVGTGLGLSISYGIVQDHGGTIDVESEPGAGTSFCIHLPLRPSPRSKAAEENGAALASGRGM